MKKSDLARRARNYGQRVYKSNGDNLHDSVAGFESGYRAARADLRRQIRAVHGWQGTTSAMGRMVLKWLRPIR